MPELPKIAPPVLSEAERDFISCLRELDQPALITRANLEAPGPTIVATSPALTVLTGYEPAELLGQNPRLLQGPLTDRTVLARLREACEKGTRFLGESVNYRKDGSAYIVQWTVEPIRNQDGALTHFFALQRDVTRERPFATEWLEAERRAATALEHASSQAATIAQAILVLEQTKRSFRSKELGALREKLVQTSHLFARQMGAENDTARDVKKSE